MAAEGPRTEAEQTITIRDRRKPRQYSIENRIMDEYRPLIGAAGLDLYNLYVRMANKRDERSWPGYSLIQEHLGIGSSTVSEMNQLLEWCGLVHIENGGSRRSNVYYILEPRPVTHEFLQGLRARVSAGWSDDRRIRRTVLARIDGWRSFLQRCGSRRRASRVKVVRAAGQMELGEGSSTGAQGSSTGVLDSPTGVHPSSAGAHPSSRGEEQSKQNNPKVTREPEQPQDQQ